MIGITVLTLFVGIVILIATRPVRRKKLPPARDPGPGRTRRGGPPPVGGHPDAGGVE